MSLRTIKIQDIVANPDQPRQHFDEGGELQRLAESIKENGLRKPIDVRPIANGNKYELIDGERRWRACSKLLGWTEIQAIVLEDVKSRKEATLQAILLNEFHKAHTAQETERAVYRLVHEVGMSIREIASAIGKKSPGSVEVYLEAYKFRQKLPHAMANSAQVTTSMLKHTSVVKDDKLRTRFIQMLKDGKIKQEAVADAAAVLAKVPAEREEVFEAYSLGMLSSLQIRSLLEGAPLGRELLLQPKEEREKNKLSRIFTGDVPLEVKQRILYKPLVSESNEQAEIERVVKVQKKLLEEEIAEAGDNKKKQEEIHHSHQLQTFDAPDEIHNFYQRYSIESLERQYSNNNTSSTDESGPTWKAIASWICVCYEHREKIRQIIATNNNEELAIAVIDLVMKVQSWEAFKRGIERDQEAHEHFMKGGEVSLTGEIIRSPRLEEKDAEIERLKKELEELRRRSKEEQGEKTREK